MNLEENNCIFCKESFDSKEELQIHFRKHGDPKFNQSVKNTKGRLSNEPQGGEKSNEDGEIVTCDVCSEVFPTISKAITHKHKVHPDHDAKYFCPWCGKLFTMKHLYNKHIQTIHNSREENEETGFHCDYCDVDFFLSSAMVYHNKFFHRQDTELAAMGHSKKMKHFHQDLLPIYYCPFCGEEYFNKVNLHKHMGDDHSDENQSPDDILRCPLCEAIFYHLDAYELHLTFHSSEDLYNEENEMAKDVTEFSLETVPPTMEKVENESQDDNETNRTSIGFEELLQQVMNESNDNDNSNNECLPEKKSKKRKKHKKSKKSAITLDEFLNMNKDVFGEGIDFQGIEEVPTQVVAKQLKKKQPSKVKSGVKKPLSDIAKLKKQGIIVKKSRNNLTSLTGKNVRVNPVGKSVNVTQKVLPNTIIPTMQSKEKAKVASNEVLSKLLNQNNSQLKIVKKSSQDTSDVNKSINTDTAEKIECDSTQNDHVPSETESDMKIEGKEVKVTSNEKISTCNEEDQSQNDSDDISDYEDNESHDMNLSDLKGRFSNIDEINVFPKVEDDVPMDSSDAQREELKNCSISNVSKSQNINMNETNALSALRNISQHITVKPMSSPKSITKKNNLNIEKECFDNPVSSSTADEVQDEVIQENKIDVDENDFEKNDNNSNNCSLSALKHLSGLITIKSFNTTNKVAVPSISTERTFSKGDSEEDSQNEGTDDEGQKEHINMKKIEKPEVQKHPTKSIDALQNLSKHITIKSLNQKTLKQKTTTEPSFESDEFDPEDDSVDDNMSKIINKNVFVNKGHLKTKSNQFTAMKTVNKAKTTDTKNESPKHSPILGKMATIEKQETDREPNFEEENPTKKQLSNILKQLPNVTAKPVNTTKIVNQQITMKSSAQCISSPKSNITQKFITKKHVQEEIEIFNIDDSDDEDVKNQTTTQNQIEVKSTVGSPKVDTEVDRKSDILRNLSKNITVKSTSKQMQTSKTNMSALKDPFDEDEAHDLNLDFSGDEANDIMKKNLKLMEQQKIVLQNTLKNLSKHISVKSANSSPKPAVKLDRPLYSKSDMLENDDDDDNSNSGSFSRVKITEINEDDVSEEEEDQNNTDNNQFSKKIIGQSSNYSNSEDENYEEKSELFLENKFKGSTCALQTPPQDPNNSNTLRNLPKGITVKSSNENKVDNTDTSAQKENPVVPNLGNEMSIKPIRPKSVRQDISEPCTTSCSRQNTINQSSKNQRFSSSSGQVNTVNKEVSVKTFQTETVIQEITTTVTKTIRTVNQTVKQEVRNTNTAQNISLPVVRTPTAVRGIRPNVQVKNIQGIQVRHGAPTAGPRIRSPMIRGRAPTGTVIRPSNQLVPFRPSINVARPSTPRMPTIRKATPSTINTPKTVIGKPLKISPNAMMPSMKRTSEDSTGHFSCFKKPKESLIPVSEVSGFGRGDSSIHFASSSQSRSNFSCTTTSKTVKGNSLVTSTQMKAEVSSSSEQLSKLSNMSGLKIVKTSHAGQATVEENSEISASKRTTLEAIEKLQKQGLLVKKPRFEDHLSENSNSNGDDGNFSDT